MTLPSVWAYALEIEAHTGSEILQLHFTNDQLMLSTWAVEWESDSFWDLAGLSVFQGGIIQPGNYEISCFSDGKTFGKSQIGFGEIILNNFDGRLDYLLDYAFDGRPAILRRLDPELVPSSVYPSDWTTVYTGTLLQPEPVIKGYNDGDLTIPWRDKMIELQTPIPLAIYKGDNALPLGLEGTADDLANKYKPLVLGKVFEISPDCVNTSLLIYGCSPPTGGNLDLVTNWDGILDFDAIIDFFGVILTGTSGQDLITDWDAVADFDTLNDIYGTRRSGVANATVYDSGVLLSAEAEYIDENDMITNAPTAGHCRWLPTYGYFRLGSTPAGQVTVSCTDASGTRNSIGSLVRSTLRDYKGWSDNQLNLLDMQTIDINCPYEMGTWVSGTGINVDEILDRFCQSAGVCYYYDTNGILRAFQVRDPATLTPDFTLSDLHIMSVARHNNNGVPAKKIIIKQQKCYTVQKSSIGWQGNKDGIAGSVSADRRTWIGLEYRENIAKNVVTGSKHLLAPTLTFETAFAEDVAAEAVRLCDLYSVRRDFLEVEILPQLFDFTTLHLGMVAQLNLSGRFGYNSKNMLLLGVTADLLNNKITLIFWG